MHLRLHIFKIIDRAIFEVITISNKSALFISRYACLKKFINFLWFHHKLLQDNETSVVKQIAMENHLFYKATS